jgi:hypothetical protein
MAKTAPIAIDLTEVYDRLEAAELEAVEQADDTRQLAAQIVALHARVIELEKNPAPIPVPVPDPLPVPAPTPTTQPVLCADPARAYAWWGAGPNRDTALKFISERVGLTEKHAGDMMVGYKGLTWVYALDLSVMLNDDADFRDANNKPNWYFIQNPEGTRYTQHIWNTDRWFWDFSKPEVRAHVIERLKTKLGNYPVLFLDEHAQIIGQPTTVVVQFLHELRDALPGKYIIVNTSQSSIHPGYIEQVRACGSFDAEIQWASGAMRGWDLQRWATLIGEVSSKGGISLLTGSIGTNGVHGDYNREFMWRLAAYWMVKGPGVYLDLMSLPANDSDLSFREWAKALEFDLGQPLGPMVGKDMGKGAIVFSREFEKGWVYVRGQDSWETKEYGWESSVVVWLSTLASKRLQSDGSLGLPVNDFHLRTADSAILVK